MTSRGWRPGEGSRASARFRTQTPAGLRGVRGPGAGAGAGPEVAGAQVRRGVLARGVRPRRAREGGVRVEVEGEGGLSSSGPGAAGQLRCGGGLCGGRSELARAGSGGGPGR